MKGFKAFILCSLTSLTLLGSSSLHATNGLRLIGMGPINLGFAGAGVAYPQSSNTIYINPAGMNEVGNEAELHFTLGFPKSNMDTHLSLAGNPAAVSVGDNNPVAVLPGGSIVFSFLDNDRLSFGLGSFLTSGFQVDYPISRINSLLTGNNFDRSARYGNLKVIPAVSYRILDNLSLGIGLDFNYAFLSTDGAVLTSPTLSETQGNSRYDAAFGFGARLGLLYQPVEMLRIGLNYSTPQFYQRFESYKDLLKDSLDMPQELTLGTAVTPLAGFTILTDFRWIDWSGPSLLGDSVAQQGFHWRDQFVFMFGLEYDFKPKFEVPVQIRTGYNYGQSSIRGDNTFVSLLAPTIGEHHLSMGLSYQINQHIGLDASYLHDFKNTVTDNGTGNPLFAGAEYSVSADIISFGIRGSWGEKAEK